MPLVTCPDCGREVSDAASSCIGCGRPMEPVSSAPKASARQDSPATPTWACPKCAGAEFKKFSLLYEENRSTSQSKTAGVGLGYGGGGFGVGVGGARSQGVSMTDLAQRVSPPDKNAMTEQANGGPLAVLMILGAGAAFFVYQVWGIAWGVGTFVALFFASAIAVGSVTGPEIEARYKSASRRWNRSYLCLRCGETVLAGEQGELQVRDRDQAYAEVDLHLRQGKKIQAIKALRDKTGLGLAEAKNQVEDRARDLNV
jgi:DNA-directed RNA polymerase subunit RPC12/RpoP